jgi:1,4-alpha-glucan branching enzyme
VADARPGQRYSFKIGNALRPDPASRFQPEGVLGPSAIVDPSSFPWTDEGWTGAPPRHRNVLYEMHIGTFTSAGTWGAARAQLQRLADLGVTTLEILPSRSSLDDLAGDTTASICSRAVPRVRHAR